MNEQHVAKIAAELKLQPRHGSQQDEVRQNHKGDGQGSQMFFGETGQGQNHSIQDKKLEGGRPLTFNHLGIHPFATPKVGNEPQRSDE